MSNTVEMLKKYIPYDEQEVKDIEIIMRAEKIFGDIHTRNNKFCHLICPLFLIFYIVPYIEAIFNTINSIYVTKKFIFLQKAFTNQANYDKIKSAKQIS